MTVIQDVASLSAVTTDKQRNVRWAILFVLSVFQMAVVVCYYTLQWRFFSARFRRMNGNCDVVSGSLPPDLVEARRRQIEQQYQRAQARAHVGPIEYDHLRLYPPNELHPALVPRVARYSPDEGMQAAVADVNIAGLPKAGTSVLFQILSSHENATALVKGYKEFCLSKGRHRDMFTQQQWDAADISSPPELTPQHLQAQRDLHAHIARNMRSFQRSAFSGKRTINSCWHVEELELLEKYLQPPHEKKTIFLFRDPADWLWSSYNYWVEGGVLDAHSDGTSSTNPQRHYRSPELFHELVAAGNRTQWGVMQHDYYQSFTVRNPRKLVALYGADRVLFVKNEDLLPQKIHQNNALERLRNFTSLSNLQPSTQIVNCNDQHGVFEVCREKSDAYAIAGGRGMLPETRTLVYLQFWEECKIWAQEFGVIYEDCLNVMEDARACAS